MSNVKSLCSLVACDSEPSVPYATLDCANNFNKRIIKTKTNTRNAPSP